MTKYFKHIKEQGDANDGMQKLIFNYLSLDVSGNISTI